MAAKSVDIEAQVGKIIMDTYNGMFSPIYLLMGDEPYYPDKVCEQIISTALTDVERDFNQTIFYGLDTDAGTVASEARSYPMMAERRLVVLKEAQSMRSLEELALYCAEPLDSTVLVILMHGASVDKRKALYKNVVKNGIVLESPAVRDYEIERWINRYCHSLGVEISPEASVLLGESAGVSLSTIAAEIDKILKNLPEGTKTISIEDVEKNVGVSRSFSIFELTKELSYKNRSKALRIASYIGSAPKFAMPMAVSALFTHFYRILKYEALLMEDKNPSASRKAAVLSVNPYFYKEYEAAVANYPIARCMQIISILEEYDFKGKGGDVGEVTAGQLLVELVCKILN